MSEPRDAVDDLLPWDGGLPPFGELIASLGGIGADDEDAADDEVLGMMEMESLRLALSIEFVVREGAGGVPQVNGSTPTQWTETTVLPVFHRLSLHVVRERDG